MKKPLKIAVIILAVILAVIVAVSVLIKSFLTEERVRALVVETVEKSLHRKTVIGAVDVSLFRGIVVRDFEIREPDAESVFFRTKEFILAYQLLPLLTRRLVIDQLSITDAEISVKVNPDGTYNFSDMARTDKPEEIKEEEKGASGLPVALNVKTIRIENAKLGYADPMGKLQKADVVLQAELNLTGHSPSALSSSGSFEVTLAQAVVKDKKTTLKDLRTTARYSLDADMEAKRLTLHFVDLDIMKIPVNISGTVDYASPTAYALAVKVPDCNLSQIPPDLASAFLPGEMTFGGNISILLHLAKKAGAENSADI
ncbi:MAG: AsmA family protein, partial [Smithellaceae bacterium]|nr:AsmA family protein [Smithellaceae bacterium]